MTVSAIRWTLGFVLAVAAAAAQSLSVTPDSHALNPAGGTTTSSVVLTFNDAASVSLDTTLPDGWTYVSGSGEPNVKPLSGARGAVNWTATTPVASPVKFSFTTTYPAGSARASVRFAALLNQTSGATKITIDPIAFGPPGAPIIAQQPQSYSAIRSGNWWLSVVAEGAPPLSYQWRKNGAPILSATNTVYGSAPASPQDSGSYDVIVSNAFGSVVSEPAVVTVSAIDPNPGQAPPIIDTDPVDSSGSAGGAASFSVLVFSNQVNTYQWLRDGAPLAGANSPALVLPNVQSLDAGAYSVVVTNQFGSVTSRTATLTVGAPATPGEPPAIITQPVSQVCRAGTVVPLSVVATGAPPLNYQWLCDGTPIIGSTGATLELSTASFIGSSDISSVYRAVVTNAIGAATSERAIVTINRGGSAPLALGSVGTVKTVAGGSAVFTAEPLGSTPFTYQWFKGTFALPGETSATLAFPNVVPSDAGQYRVEYANAFGSGRALGTLTVLPAPVAPSFVFQPGLEGNPGAVDAATRIRANVDGTVPFSFQWLKNGREISGGTSNPLVISRFQASDAGSYTLRVANSAGTITSSPVTVTFRNSGFASIGIGPAQLPAIAAQPHATTVRQGAHATLSISAVSDITPLSYQWRRDGVAISGANGASYTVSAVAAADAGDYSAVVWNARGMVVSEAAHLTVSGHSYAGDYFGTIVGSDAPSRPSPMLVRVSDQNVAVCLGSYIYGRTFTIDDTGRFLIDQPATSGSIAGADAAFTFSGAFTTDGSVTGAYYHPLSGTRATLSATRAPATGPTQMFAGTYIVNVQNSSATGSLVLDANGHAFASVGTAERGDFGVGTVDATGKISVAGAIDAQISGTVRADGIASLNVTSLGTSPPLVFRGGRDNRLELERVVNISTRAAAGAVDTNPLIAGFVLAGTEPKTVLLRAIGPALAQFGVSNPLAAARLDLFRGAAVVASNAGWDTGGTTTTALIAATADRVGAFTLPPGSKNAALLITLEPGAYTAHVSGLNGATGVALVEAYDATIATPAPERRLINISSRAQTGTGENALVAGFVVSGTQPKRVLIRGVGPGLAQFGVPDFLGDPQLQLFDAVGATLATNDNWSSGANLDLFPTINSAQLAAGAFALPVQSKDSALVISLAPGNYTAQVTGVGSATGVALVEVYEVP